jgi:hypothetical protein
MAQIIRHCFQEIPQSKSVEQMPILGPSVAKFIVNKFPELLVVVVKYVSEVGEMGYFSCFETNLAHEASDVLEALLDHFVLD